MSMCREVLCRLTYYFKGPLKLHKKVCNLLSSSELFVSQCSFPGHDGEASSMQPGKEKFYLKRKHTQACLNSFSIRVADKMNKSTIVSNLCFPGICSLRNSWFWFPLILSPHKSSSFIKGAGKLSQTSQ